MNPYQAGQQLGQLVFGAPEDTGGARNPGLIGMLSGQAVQPGGIYEQTLTRGARGAEAMEQARKARTAAMIEELMLKNRQALPGAVAGVYTDPAQAALVASTVGANQTVDLRNAGTFQNPGAAAAYTRLGDAAASGDQPAANRAISQITMKPLETTKVEGNTVVNPFGPTGQAVTATPLGNAAIAADNARAGYYDARVAKGATGDGKQPAAASPTDAILTALGQSKDDPDSTVRALARYRAAVNDGARTPAQIMDWGVAHPPLGTPAMGGEAAGDSPGAPAGVNMMQVPQRPALGDAVAPGSRVQIEMAPGTDPRVIAAARAAASADQAGSVARPTNKAEFAAIPRGALYLNPADGKTYRKN